MQYDIVLNGWELGGGSVRIWRRDLLERSLALQGHSAEAMHEKFGAMLDAFDYGAPPHGGIALGIDRWAALFSKQTNIREVMAFPKTQSGGDLMLEAPSPPEPEQLAELGLRFVGGSKARRRSRRRRSRQGRASPPRSTLRLGFLEPIARRPRLAALIGAMCIAFSGIFYRFAEVSPATATVFRCLYGLPILALVGWYEHRRYGPLPSRAVWLAVIAGVFFAGDLLSWHHAVDAVGAGLATVLGNLQVLVVGLVAWLAVQGAAAGAGAARAADRARRRRADLGGRRLRRVRRESAARCRRWASSPASRTRATC